MKQKLFIGLLVLSMARLVLGQASSVYINNGTITSPPSDPPQIDATNFINNGEINIAFNSYTGVSTVLAQVVFLNTSIQPFEFSDVLNYTNRGTMSCDTGFVFDTEPSSFGSPHMASSFGNANIGSITSGSAINSFASTSFHLFCRSGIKFFDRDTYIAGFSNQCDQCGVDGCGLEWINHRGWNECQLGSRHPQY